MGMNCQVCGKEMEEWEAFSREGRVLCPECFYSRLDDMFKGGICTSCGKRLSSNEVRSFGGRTFCEQCLSAERERMRLQTCERCGAPLGGSVFIVHGMRVCVSCYHNLQPKEPMPPPPVYTHPHALEKKTSIRLTEKDVVKSVFRSFEEWIVKKKKK